MKKLIISILILISLKGFTQLTGTSTITFTGGDWCYILGSKSAEDSTEISVYGRIRDTLRAAAGNFNTQVRFTGISNQFLYNVYVNYKNIPSTLFDQVGTNIGTQIKAVSNTPLQNAITAFDNNAQPLYISIRRRGKNIALDN